jgi:hypothetical protein
LPELFRWLTPLHQTEWVVYSKAPFGGPEQVLKCLARYTHRVAISNSRIEEVSDTTVTFTAKDYAEGGRRKSVTLPAAEFLRRWVQHVLPKGFVKVRHYGLLANRKREAHLAECRRLLLAEPARQAAAPTAAAAAVSCPACGCTVWRMVEELPRPGRLTPLAAVAADTS